MNSSNGSDDESLIVRRPQPKPRRRPRPTPSRALAAPAPGGPASNNQAAPSGSPPPDDDFFFRRQPLFHSTFLSQTLESPTTPAVNPDESSPTQISKRKSDDALSSPEVGSQPVKRSSPKNANFGMDNSLNDDSDSLALELDTLSDDDKRSISLTPPPTSSPLHRRGNQLVVTLDDTDIETDTLLSPKRRTRSQTYRHHQMISSPSFPLPYELDPELEAIASNMASKQLELPSSPRAGVTLYDLTQDDDDDNDQGYPRISARGSSPGDTTTSIATLLNHPPPASSSSINQPDTPLVNLHFLIKVRSTIEGGQLRIIQDSTVTYAIHTNQPLGETFDLVASNIGYPRFSLIMLYQDVPLFDHVTPASLDLHDDVIIEVYTRTMHKHLKAQQAKEKQEYLKQLEEAAELENRLARHLAHHTPDPGNGTHTVSSAGPKESQLSSAPPLDSHPNVLDEESLDYPDKDDSDAFVKLKLRNKENIDVKLKVRRSTTVQTLVDQYVKRQSLNLNQVQVRIEFEGEILGIDDCIEDLDLEDGDMLTVVVQSR
ncbi:Protein esc2 [Dispira simplex]|nr:Protein esc2 [Dispira simplex]